MVIVKSFKVVDYKSIRFQEFIVITVKVAIIIKQRVVKSMAFTKMQDYLSSVQTYLF